MSNWGNYWKNSSPYSCAKHEAISYKLTYSDLENFLRTHVTDNSLIIDLGAGTGQQFNFCPQLLKYKWICIEPFALFDYKSDKRIHFYEQLYDCPTNLLNQVQIITLLSISQYLGKNGLNQYIRYISKNCLNSHSIIISDVISPDSFTSINVIIYLINSIRFGYFIKAIIHLILMVFGEYYKIFSVEKLRSYDYDELELLAKKYGYLLKKFDSNFGYNFHRNSYIFIKI